MPDDIITFGKLKGMPFSALELDPKYLDWVCNKMDRKYMSNSLLTYLTQKGYIIPNTIIEKRENATDNENIINWGKYKGRRYDQLPLDYLKFIVKSTEESKNAGDKLFVCKDQVLLNYAKQELNC